jgi:hypothetical protein
LLSNFWFYKQNAHCTLKVHTRPIAKSSWKVHKRTQRITRAGWMNNSYEFTRFARTRINMNAYLKGIHKQKKLLPPHQIPSKFIITQWITTNTKESATFFAISKVWDSKNLKNFKHLNAYPSTLKKSKALKSEYA